jgi:hypothetical protein
MAILLPADDKIDSRPERPSEYLGGLGSIDHLKLIFNGFGNYVLRSE